VVVTVLDAGRWGGIRFASVCRSMNTTRQESGRWLAIGGDGRTVVAIVLGCLMLAGCAAGNPRFDEAEPAGFWFGLWHGLIACVAFVVGLFDDSVQIYERVNNGAWYDLGFLIGVMAFSGSGHQSHGRWRASKAECKRLEDDE
jgi:hypothetical protein